MLIPFVNHAAIGYDAPLPAEVLAEVAKLGVAGDVFVHLPPQTRTDKGLAHVKPLLQRVGCRVGPFLPSEAEVASSFLDAGARFVAFDVHAAAGEAGVEAVAEALASLPRQRLLVWVHEDVTPPAGTDGAAAADGAGALPHAVLSDAVAAAVTALRDLVAGVVVVTPANVEIHSDYHKALRGAAGPRTLVAVRPLAPSFRASELGRLHKHDVGVVYPACVAMGADEIAAADGTAPTPRLDVGACLAACARSDRPDGLFTTVVSDECGKTLGLVYSNGESVAESIRCGRGVYYSRSR